MSMGSNSTSTHWVSPTSDIPLITLRAHSVHTQMKCGQCDQSHGGFSSDWVQSLSLQWHPWKRNGPCIQRITRKSTMTRIVLVEQEVESDRQWALRMESCRGHYIQNNPNSSWNAQLQEGRKKDVLKNISLSFHFASQLGLAPCLGTPCNELGYCPSLGLPALDGTL